MGKCYCNKKVKKKGISMYHFFAEHNNIHDTYIDITGSDVNHIKNVLRFKVGDELLISSGDNVDYSCHISEMQDDYIRAEIDAVDECGKELPSKIYLFQGLPKGDKMEFIIQKAVELGVFEVVPVAMKRCVVKLDDKKAQNKVKRWNGIAESAAKQSKRSIMPKVRDVLTFKQAVDMARACDVKLLPYECADGMSKTKQLIDNLQAGKSVAIFIGPEGGFDQSELDYAIEAGCEIITLGKRILRTETAGMMLLSVLMYHFEE
jgi:16S rRNA (uracil1498-N3)-methyltransferase